MFLALDIVYTWLGAVVFDICVFCLTVWKTFVLWKSGQYMSDGVVAAITRDGEYH